jgi:hypothetical protein
MRGMHLPNCVIPDSEEWAAGLYWTRMRKGLALPLELSFLLSAYVLWPSDGDEPKRNSWVSTLAEATHVAHDKKTALSDVSELFGGISSLLRPALSALNDEVIASETRLIPVGDIFLRFVDIRFAEDLDLRGGASIAKAIDPCASDPEGKSQAVLYKCWSDYKDVGPSHCCERAPGRSDQYKDFLSSLVCTRVGAFPSCRLPRIWVKLLPARSGRTSSVARNRLGNSAALSSPHSLYPKTTALARANQNSDRA